jgi:hypothetical protein
MFYVDGIFFCLVVVIARSFVQYQRTRCTKSMDMSLILPVLLIRRNLLQGKAK